MGGRRDEVRVPSCASEREINLAPLVCLVEMVRHGRSAPSSVPQSAGGPVDSTYDFHGLFRVRVEHRGLDALMRRELSVFLADGDDPDLTIEEGPVPRP